MFEHEAGRIRALTKEAETRVWFKRHALEEMKNDGIYRIDVENMLRSCRVTLVEESKGEDTWRCEGKDSEGREIAAVVVPYEDDLSIKVITAWAVGT